MLIISDRKLRSVIREELERFMSSSSPPPTSYSITSATGGELIMPNVVQERFNEGSVTSIKDIIQDAS